MLLSFATLALSIVALYIGAEWTLGKAEKVGPHLGLSPLAVGLIIVGLGTSLPELFVSQLAVIRGSSGLALGNIIGSNIANLFFILGLSGIMASIPLKGREIREVAIGHIVLTVLLGILLTRESLDFMASGILGVFFVTYMIKLFKQGGEEVGPKEKIGALDIFLLICGLGFLYIGGELLVKAGKELGVFFGLSNYVVSAILLAFGTSLPELVTSCLAVAKKKDLNMITGNIIGSNIFNVAVVLTSIGPYKVAIDRNFAPEIVVLILGGIIIAFLAKHERPFVRPLGVLFVLTYIGMNVYWLV